ncbi:MAG: RHS repeat protein, partial [Planctomycetaceae bacterium]|nr:RHS repeat protein [Planctomycetaceae bacterium]
MGQIRRITSLDGEGGVVNQILYDYDENGLLRREYTAHSGVADASFTPFIGYGYDTSKNGGCFINALRLISVTYPSGKEVSYGYDNYGRVASVLEGNVPVVEYAYQGLGSALRTTYTEPGLTLDYSVSGALDKFGRVVSHAWKNSLGAAILNIEHGYDRSGNRLYRNDLVQAANSELYAYDEVNQIKSLNRGALSNNNTAVASVSHSESWNFDETGNWVQYNKNNTVENRSHNAANEIQSLVSHDKNGNMTVMPGLNCKYDAWNRLVKVNENIRYEYNGLNYRIKKIVGGVETKSFFNKQWQELESRTEMQSLDCVSYIWGLRYIDDLILREKGAERLYSLADPNWNVVALTDVSGIVQERMKYDAFG